jgi:hypothetical protein
MNTKTHIATDAEIRTMAQHYVDARASGENVRATYLRALAARTIGEIGAPVRANAAKAAKLTEEARVAHLAALEVAHAKLYAIVVDVAERSLDGVPSKDRALEKNRRTNFARTARYAVRSYIKAGRDITALAPARITKVGLAIRATPAPRSPKRLRGRVERLSKSFMAALLELGEADSEGAAAELDTLIGQMATQLATLGTQAPVRDPARAAREHAPLKVGKQLFIPTQTAILRSRQNPS